jgi:hypothetical protein
MHYAAGSERVTKLPGSESSTSELAPHNPVWLHPAKPATDADALALHQATHAPVMVLAPQFAEAPQLESCAAKMANIWRSRLGSAADRRADARGSAAPDRWYYDPIRCCAAFVPDTIQRRPKTNYRNDPHPHSVPRPRTTGRTQDRLQGTAYSLRCRATWCRRSRRSPHAVHPMSSPRPRHVPHVPPAPRVASPPRGSPAPRASRPRSPQPGALSSIARPLWTRPGADAPASAATGPPARPPAPHWRPIRSAIAGRLAHPSLGHAACWSDFAQPPSNA